MYQFFAPRSSCKSPVRLPESYREKARWHPRLGDKFPYCVLNTNEGKKSVADLSKDKWTVFFSLPQAYTPVCSAELASFSRYQDDFRELGVTLIAFSQSTIECQREWHAMMEAQFGIKVRFAFIEDPDLSIAKCFGMLHPRESTDRMIRKSFVLDPQQTIRSIVEYPEGIMRNVAEVLDHVKSLQELDNVDRTLAASREHRSGVLLLRNPSEPVVPRRVSSRPMFRDDIEANRPKPVLLD